jgi:hypothetical protein
MKDSNEFRLREAGNSQLQRPVTGTVGLIPGRKHMCPLIRVSYRAKKRLSSALIHSETRFGNLNSTRCE